MIRNGPADFAQRLYDRLPAHYRAYDAEEGAPLFTLLQAVGEQAANVRQDLDALWENFFIETCEEWVVPYLAGLVGTNLLADPVAQSNRLDVRNTVAWRRSKGTPAMLRALAQAISGWPADPLAEFFASLGWSQNLNHLRLTHPLTPDLRDPFALSLLGHALDPHAHAADPRPATPLAGARVTPRTLGVGLAAWGTPGRYQIKNAGLFLHRLQTFALSGVTPAAAAPGLPLPADAACFTFDPLFHDTPLFVRESGAALTRDAFAQAPAIYWGADVAVRQFGVLLASAANAAVPEDAAGVSEPRSFTFAGTSPVAIPVQPGQPFTFGGAGAGLTLHPTAGLRLLEPASFQGSPHFVVTAGWRVGAVTTTLGSTSTLRAAIGASDAFQTGAATPSAGRLTLTVQLGRDGLGWPGLPASPAGRFPGGVIAVRAAASGPQRAADALYLALPPLYLAPGEAATFFVADDGASYTAAGLEPASLARPAPGGVSPPRPLTARTALPAGFIRLDRRAGGMRIVDQGRFAGAGALFTAELFSGALEPLGAIATVNQAAASHPDYVVPDPWPAFTYAPSQMAVSDSNDTRGKLVVQVTPLAGAARIPRTELVVRNRAGHSLLVYLPELAGAPAAGVAFLVADDGSTWFLPAEADALFALDQAASLDGLTLARASAGQVLPIPGTWPLQQRRPVSLDLCDCARRALLHRGEIGIDPEIGRFALAAGDPAIGSADLTVDYVEAFSGEVGARTFDRELQPVANPATLRLVSRTGDGIGTGGIEVPPTRRHASIAQALASAADGDVIEIVDSATYIEPLPAPVATAAQALTVRAAPGQRPCLAFFQTSGAATAASLQVAHPMSALTLNGLLISGGPVQITRRIDHLELLACTLDPRGGGPTLVASDGDAASLADYLLCRCITGGVRAAPGVAHLTIADSIVDQPGALALAGFDPAQAEPALRGLHLERTTVLGGIRCDTLEASECLLDEAAIVNDRQVGCIRFSRYERGSALPRRFQCVPSADQATSCPPHLRCLPPLFQARRLGRPDYAQLASATSPAILTGSEAGAEVGAFASRRNAIRQGNLEIKLREFLPVGLRAQLIAET